MVPEPFAGRLVFDMHEQHLITPGTKVSLESLSTRGRDFTDDRKSAEKQFRSLRDELISLQYRLYAEHRQSLLVVLQAPDTAGKDSTIRNVFEGVNPQGVRVASFKKPSTVERNHDFLWRVHQQAPPQGHITVFNRSHYEDVLVVRVDNLAPEAVWRPRFEQINQFEALLHSAGTRVIKFFLHISKDEQKERLQDRLDEPEKHWKFDVGDLAKREQWDEYRVAYEEAISSCSTQQAPWYVIPADNKWYRNLVVTEAIVAALRQMDPQYPEVDFDPSTIQIN